MQEEVGGLKGWLFERHGSLFVRLGSRDAAVAGVSTRSAARLDKIRLLHCRVHTVCRHPNWKLAPRVSQDTHPGLCLSEVTSYAPECSFAGDVLRQCRDMPSFSNAGVQGLFI